MNDDEFDEMLRARHKAFVADVAAVPRPAFRAATAPPAVSRIALLADAVGSRLAFLTRWLRGPKAIHMATGITAAAMALAIAAISQIEWPVERQMLAAAPPQGPVTSTVPELTLHAPPPDTDSQLAIVVDSLSLRFAPDSVEVNGTDVVRLRAIAARMQPGEYVLVVGHTARVGPPDTAIEFSTRRALAVKSVLVESGVPASAISASGVGYRFAAAGVDDRDRRVAVTVV